MADGRHRIENIGDSQQNEKRNDRPSPSFSSKGVGGYHPSSKDNRSSNPSSPSSNAPSSSYGMKKVSSRSQTKRTNSKHSAPSYSSSFRNGAPADISGYLRRGGIPGQKKFYCLKGCMLFQYAKDQLDQVESCWCIYGSEIMFSVKDTLIHIKRWKLRLYLTDDIDKYIEWARCLKQMSQRRIQDCYTISNQVIATLNESEVVYIGYDIASQEKVRIRVIKRSLCSALDLKRIERESQILMMVNHPNVLETYDIFDSENYLYIVSRFMEGGTLKDRLDEMKFFTEAEVLEIARSLLGAIASLHRQGIVHGNIRPESVFCESSKWPLKPKLGGFTHWYKVGEETDGVLDSSSPQIMGSWCYLSPEQINREIQCGPAVDMWAFGVFLYELLSGTVPFQAETIIETLKLIRGGNVEFGPRFFGCSEECKQMITDLLQKNSDSRMSSEKMLKTHWINPYQAEEKWLVDGVEGMKASLSLIEKVLSFPSRKVASHSKLAISNTAAHERERQSEFLPVVLPRLDSVDMHSFTSADETDLVSSSDELTPINQIVFGQYPRKGSRSNSSQMQNHVSSNETALARGRGAVFGIDDSSSARSGKGVLNTIAMKGGTARGPAFLQ